MLGITSHDRFVDQQISGAERSFKSYHRPLSPFDHRPTPLQYPLYASAAPLSHASYQLTSHAEPHVNDVTVTSRLEYHHPYASSSPYHHQYPLTGSSAPSFGFYGSGTPTQPYPLSNPLQFYSPGAPLLKSFSSPAAENRLSTSTPPSHHSNLHPGVSASASDTTNPPPPSLLEATTSIFLSRFVNQPACLDHVHSPLYAENKPRSSAFPSKPASSGCSSSGGGNRSSSGSSGGGRSTNHPTRKTKKHPTAVPLEQKDTRYWERRRKNNVAAKRSRETRCEYENVANRRFGLLERENAQLRAEIGAFEEEVEQLRRLNDCSFVA